jgi:uncharacterized membrane protein HdeD (DUF308 family)
VGSDQTADENSGDAGCRSAREDINPRRASRRSLIAFLGGLALLAAALLATGLFPVLSTVAAIVGIAAMIYGLAAGVMIVLNREDDGSPD